MNSSSDSLNLGIPPAFFGKSFYLLRSAHLLDDFGWLLPHRPLIPDLGSENPVVETINSRGRRRRNRLQSAQNRHLRKLLQVQQATVRAI